MSDPEEIHPRRGSKGGGKRSDPEFVVAAFYVRRETYQAMKIASLKGGESDANILVQQLLAEWLTRQAQVGEGQE